MNEIQLVKVTIDDVEVQVPAGSTIIQAANKAARVIPYFCYHPGLSIVGQCRMCFVEIEGAPKLATACSTPVAEGMKVKTQSEKVKAGQNATLEFTLLNHPLDCPICDRGGECKLQDYTYDYGPPVSRMLDDKELKDKHKPVSEAVMLDQERCIVCTRCVRFSSEVDGRTELVVNQRGSADVIDVFNDRPMQSPFQGNVVDLCPVGALTATDYRFVARPWELKKHDGICTGCSVGCNVELHTKHRHPGIARPDKAAPHPSIMRLVPLTNPNVNTWWMCDKGRWGYHFHNQDSKRITNATFTRTQGGAPESVHLNEVQALIEEKSKAFEWEFWISSRSSHEEIQWAKELAKSWSERGRKVTFFNSAPFGQEFIAWTATRATSAWTAGTPDWSSISEIFCADTYRDLEPKVPVLALKLGQRVRSGKIKWSTSTQGFRGEAHQALLVDPPQTSAELESLKKLKPEANVLILWQDTNSRGLANEGIAPAEMLGSALKGAKAKKAVFFFSQTNQNPLPEALEAYLASAPFLILADSFKSSLSEKANVVLPLNPLYESQATFTSVEGYRQLSKGIHLDHPNVKSIHRGGPAVNPALKML